MRHALWACRSPLIKTRLAWSAAYPVGQHPGVVPPREADWPSSAEMCLGQIRGTYAVTCRPPSYSKCLGDGLSPRRPRR